MDSLSFTDFASASRAVLSYLHRKLGFKLWMVTRTEGEDWIVLDAEDHGYGVEAGTVFRWADSFCSCGEEGGKWRRYRAAGCGGSRARAPRFARSAGAGGHPLANPGR